MKRTKIVCTIGPATDSVTKIKQLLRAGMSVARLNFSHGTHEQHSTLINTIRRASKEVGIPCAILQDLQGPRIRIGELQEPVKIKKWQSITLVPERGASDAGHGRRTTIPQQYAGLAHDVKKGTMILIADGAMRLRVERTDGEKIHAVVIQGGIVKAHKGLNVPGVTLSASAMTAKDKKDLAFGLARGVDFVTLSFVKSARDMQTLRRRIEDARPKHAPHIIAKVERPEAIEKIDAIVAASDAIMLGRGDLALEANPAKLAVMQRDVIAACMAQGKPVITATQMLENMVENPQPTRAELSDIGHAVMDHTDATMLSGETASGKYPVEAVKVMADVITETEASAYDDVAPSYFGEPKTPEGALGYAVAVNVKQLNVDAIIVMPDALSALPKITRLRPEAQIIPVLSSEAESRPYHLAWGNAPVVGGKSARSAAIVKKLIEGRRLKRGSTILIINRIPEDRTTVDTSLTLLRV
jgi:pyruvate kinase